MATLRLPAMGYGLRYEYGMFKQSIQDGWQQEQPDNWLRQPDPWEIARLDEARGSQVRLLVRATREQPRAHPNRPSTLIAFLRPADRRLRRHHGQYAAAVERHPLPTTSTSSDSALAKFVGALAETLAAESLTRVLYPDDSTTRVRDCASSRNIFWSPVPGRSDSRFRRGNADWHRMPEKGGDPAQRHSPGACGPGAHAHPPRRSAPRLDEAWDLTQRTLAYTNHTLLPEALEKWPLACVRAAVARNLEIIFEINRRFLDDVRARFPGDTDVLSA